MNFDWLDDNTLNDLATTNDSSDGCYCPFTSGDKCAVLANGWQPQELCHALECSQLKLIDQGARLRNEAA